MSNTEEGFQYFLSGSQDFALPAQENGNGKSPFTTQPSPQRGKGLFKHDISDDIDIPLSLSWVSPIKNVEEVIRSEGATTADRLCATENTCKWPGQARDDGKEENRDIPQDYDTLPLEFDSGGDTEVETEVEDNNDAEHFHEKGEQAPCLSGSQHHANSVQVHCLTDEKPKNALDDDKTLGACSEHSTQPLSGLIDSPAPSKDPLKRVEANEFHESPASIPLQHSLVEKTDKNYSGCSLHHQGQGPQESFGANPSFIAATASPPKEEKEEDNERQNQYQAKKAPSDLPDPQQEVLCQGIPKIPENAAPPLTAAAAAAAAAGADGDGASAAAEEAEAWVRAWVQRAPAGVRARAAAAARQQEGGAEGARGGAGGAGDAALEANVRFVLRQTVPEEVQEALLSLRAALEESGDPSELEELKFFEELMVDWLGKLKTKEGQALGASLLDNEGSKSVPSSQPAFFFALKGPYLSQTGLSTVMLTPFTGATQTQLTQKRGPRKQVATENQGKSQNRSDPVLLEEQISTCTQGSSYHIQQTESPDTGVLHFSACQEDSTTSPDGKQAHHRHPNSFGKDETSGSSSGIFAVATSQADEFDTVRSIDQLSKGKCEGFGDHLLGGSLQARHPNSQSQDCNNSDDSSSLQMEIETSPRGTHLKGTTSLVADQHQHDSRHSAGGSNICDSLHGSFEESNVVSEDSFKLQACSFKEGSSSSKQSTPGQDRTMSAQKNSQVNAAVIELAAPEMTSPSKNATTSVIDVVGPASENPTAATKDDGVGGKKKETIAVSAKCNSKYKSKGALDDLSSNCGNNNKRICAPQKSEVVSNPRQPSHDSDPSFVREESLKLQACSFKEGSSSSKQNTPGQDRTVSSRTMSAQNESQVNAAVIELATPETPSPSQNATAPVIGAVGPAPENPPDAIKDDGLGVKKNGSIAVSAKCNSKLKSKVTLDDLSSSCENNKQRSCAPPKSEVVSNPIQPSQDSDPWLSNSVPRTSILPVDGNESIINKYQGEATLRRPTRDTQAEVQTSQLPTVNDSFTSAPPSLSKPTSPALPPDVPLVGGMLLSPESLTCSGGLGISSLPFPAQNPNWKAAQQNEAKYSSPTGASKAIETLVPSSLYDSTQSPSKSSQQMTKNRKLDGQSSNCLTTSSFDKTKCTVGQQSSTLIQPAPSHNAVRTGFLPIDSCLSPTEVVETMPSLGAQNVQNQMNSYLSPTEVVESIPSFSAPREYNIHKNQQAQVNQTGRCLTSNEDPSLLLEKSGAHSQNTITNPQASAVLKLSPEKSMGVSCQKETAHAISAHLKQASSPPCCRMDTKPAERTTGVLNSGQMDKNSNKPHFFSNTITSSRKKGDKFTAQTSSNSQKESNECSQANLQGTESFFKQKNADAVAFMDSQEYSQMMKSPATARKNLRLVGHSDETNRCAENASREEDGEEDQELLLGTEIAHKPTMPVILKVAQSDEDEGTLADTEDNLALSLTAPAGTDALSPAPSRKSRVGPPEGFCKAALPALAPKLCGPQTAIQAMGEVTKSPALHFRPHASNPQKVQHRNPWSCWSGATAEGAIPSSQDGLGSEFGASPSFSQDLQTICTSPRGAQPAAGRAQRRRRPPAEETSAPPAAAAAPGGSGGTAPPAAGRRRRRRPPAPPPSERGARPPSKAAAAAAAAQNRGRGAAGGNPWGRGAPAPCPQPGGRDRALLQHQERARQLEELKKRKLQLLAEMGKVQFKAGNCLYQPRNNSLQRDTNSVRKVAVTQSKVSSGSTQASKKTMKELSVFAVLPQSSKKKTASIPGSGQTKVPPGPKTVFDYPSSQSQGVQCKPFATVSVASALVRATSLGSHQELEAKVVSPRALIGVGSSGPSSPEELEFDAGAEGDWAHLHEKQEEGRQGYPLTFKEIWHMLKSQGWHYETGRGELVDWFYVMPGKTSRTGTLGVDYFDSPEALLRYYAEAARELRRPAPPPLRGSDDAAGAAAAPAAAVVEEEEGEEDRAPRRRRRLRLRRGPRPPPRAGRGRAGGGGDEREGGRGGGSSDGEAAPPRTGAGRAPAPPGARQVTPPSAGRPRRTLPRGGGGRASPERGEEGRREDRGQGAALSGIPWPVVWNELRKEGWTWARGSGLVDYLYRPPGQSKGGLQSTTEVLDRIAAHPPPGLKLLVSPEENARAFDRGHNQRLALQAADSKTPAAACREPATAAVSSLATPVSHKRKRSCKEVPGAESSTSSERGPPPAARPAVGPGVGTPRGGGERRVAPPKVTPDAARRRRPPTPPLPPRCREAALALCPRGGGQGKALATADVVCLGSGRPLMAPEDSSNKSAAMDEEAGWKVPFKELWKQLKAKGWTYAKGPFKLVNWVYLKPGVLKHQGRCGIDIFYSEEEVRRYVMASLSAAPKEGASAGDVHVNGKDSSSIHSSGGESQKQHSIEKTLDLHEYYSVFSADLLERKKKRKKGVQEASERYESATENEVKMTALAQSESKYLHSSSHHHGKKRKRQRNNNNSDFVGDGASPIQSNDSRDDQKESQHQQKHSIEASNKNNMISNNPVASCLEEDELDFCQTQAQDELLAATALVDLPG